MRARIATLAAVAVAGLGLVALTTPATAAPPMTDRANSANCTIRSFSPRSVVLGETPDTVTFGISTSGCSLADWSLNDDTAVGFFADKDSPQDTFDPAILSNSDAGLSSVIATADNPDFHETQHSFVRGFDLRRRVAVQSGTLNASPEPVRKGGTESIVARLMVVNWDTSPNSYVSFAGHEVAVQFRTLTGSYTTVKNVKTDSTGWVRTTATQSASGVWRVAYGGTTVFSSATVSGDSVKVS